ncbi:hypothetical protein CEQ90_09530 [Lewinellaceae bacterium SD302]|nr:hypothetical protein CEQ90_09530 [Lewinellaceae bacterium SD302]
MRLGGTILTLLLLPLLWLGCGEREDDKTAAARIITEKMNRRVAGFRSNFHNDCQEKVLEAARARADSLLRERARRLTLLAGRPPKPRRPGAPAEKQLSRELPLRPLFPFEIRFDTLLRDSLLRDSLRLDSLQMLEIDSLNGTTQ